MYCKKCGKSVDPHAKFCSNCGAEIKEEKITFDFDRPSKHTEPEKKNIHITKENFKWDLDGFPSEDKSGTEDVDFNWDSVLDTKRRDRSVYEEPISFTEKKPEPVKKAETEDEIKIEPVPEKYELSDLFGEDIKKNSHEDVEDATEIIEEDDDIMELSFEDEIFGDLKDEKPASATIRISQTIHFTDQLYSFDNKQAEYQSILDEEYDKLQNGEEDDENEEMPVPVMPELEEVKSFEDLESGEPEFRTGIASDDFLRELYGTTEPETETTEDEAVEEKEAPEAEENYEEESAEFEEEAEEINVESEEADGETAEEPEAEPSFVNVEEILSDKEEPEDEVTEEAEAADEEAAETAETEETVLQAEPLVEEPENTAEEVPEAEADEEEVPEEETQEEETQEEDVPEEETHEEETHEEDVPEASQDAEEEDEIISEESVPADGLECVGVALARTPRGVLVLQKSNKDKLTRRTILPSKETEETETKGNTETEKENSSFEKQPEKDRNEKLSFGDVFNDADDDDDNDDYKPKKKGEALRIIAVILFIAIIIELAFIGIQHFAPESEVAKQLNLIYGRVVEKIMPGEEPEVIEEEDLVVTSPVNDYVVAKAGKYSNIAGIDTDVELKFSESNYAGLEGFDEAGIFTDGEWFKDEDGNSVTYGQAIVESVCGFYNALTDYKNSANEDVRDLITENSPVEEIIDKIESGEEIYAVNNLVIGEIRTSTSGIYVAAKVEETNNEAENPETKNIVIYLRPVEHELKVDNIVYL